MFTPPEGALIGANGAGRTATAAVEAYLKGLREDQVLARLAAAYAPLSVSGNLGPVDALDSVTHADRLVVVGSPGTGKTTLLRLAARLAAGAPDDGRPHRVPVYLDLAKSRDGEGVDELTARALEGVGGVPLSLAALDAALLLFDNLDRVSDVYLLEGLEILFRAGGRVGPSVVMACREGDWPLFASWFHDVPAMTLQPLAPTAVREALTRGLPSGVSEDAVNWLERDRNLGAAVRRPIALGSLLAAVRDRPASAWRRGMVLDALLESFLRDVPAAERPAYRTALSDVAVRSLEMGLPVEVDTVGMALGVSRDKMIATGAVLADGPRLAFVEPLLAHHCAAAALAGRSGGNPRRLAERLGGTADVRLADTLVHVYSLAPSPADFVAALLPLENGPEIAARCISEPQGAEPLSAGPEAVVTALVALPDPIPAKSLFRLGEALARHSQEPAAEIALRAALDRTAGDVDLDEIFERSDVGDAPPISDWVRDFLRNRNRGLALKGLGDAAADGALASAAQALDRLDADLSFERGLAAFEAGDWQRAAAGFETALTADPDAVRYLFHYGRSLLALGRTEEALAVLTRARRVAPANAALEAALAEALWATDDVAGARAHIHEARELDPAQPAFDHLAGALSAELGELETAATRLREAVAASPGEPDWHDALGQVLAESGDSVMAAGAFRRALELDPLNGTYARHMGQALLEAGDMDSAVAALREAVRLTDGEPGAQADLARALAVRGDSAEALKVLAAAVAADDGWPADHLLMARLARETGDLDRAARHARTAVKLAPASERARSELLRIEQARGTANQADPELLPRPKVAHDLPEIASATPVQELPEWLARQAAADAAPASAVGIPTEPITPPVAPANVTTSANAAASVGTGHRVAALDEDSELANLAAVAERHPDDAHAQRQYAHALRAAGQAERAMGVMRRAARLDPSDPMLLADLGWAALDLGRMNEARYAAGAALEMSPDNAELLALSGDVELAAGEPEAAWRAYAHAAAVAPHHPGYARKLAEIEAALVGPDDDPTHQHTASAFGSEELTPTQPPAAHSVPPLSPAATPASPQRYDAYPASTPHRVPPAHTYAPAAAPVADRAAALRRQGRIPEAIAQLEIARDEGASDAATLEELAACYDMSGRDEAALEAYAAAVASGAGVSACLAWSRRARALGVLDDAIAGARQAVALDADSAESYGELSAAYEGSGLMEAALTAVARAASLDPTVPGYRERQATLATRLGRLDEAVAALEEGLADNPRAARLHFALGQAFAGRGWSAEARTSLRKAAHLAPSDPRIQSALAANLAADDPEAAVAAQERAVSADPENIPAWLALGRLQNAAGFDDEAEASYHQVLAMDPLETEALRGRAISLVRLGSPDAEDAFRACLAADPNDAKAAAGLAALCAAAGHEVAAIEAYGVATALDPQNVDAWVALGGLRRSAGDISGALAALGHATELDPDRDDAFESLGGTLAEMGRYAEAAAAFQQAARRRQADPELQVRLGKTRLGARDSVGAAAAFEMALAACPDHLEALLGLSEAAVSSGRFDAAVQHALRATELAPEDPATWSAYAQAARAIGDLEVATEALGRAAEVAPDVPETLRLFAQVALDQGNMKVAAAALCRLLALDGDDRAAAVALAELSSAEGYTVPLVCPEATPPIDVACAEAVFGALERASAHDSPDGLAARAAKSLAVIRGRLGDVSGALTAAARATALDEDPETLRVLAWARLLADEPGPALAALGLARALGADDAGIHLLAASAHVRRGDYSLAAEAYRLAARREPELAEAFAGLGACQAALGRAEASIEAYRQASALDPDGRYDGDLGRMALAAGAYDEAVASLSRFCTAHPGAPEARRDLARAYAARGEKLRAAEELHRAVTLAPNHADWFAQLAELQCDLGETAAARETLARAMDIDGGNSVYRLTDARLALAEGDSKAAKAAVMTALESSPDSPEANGLLGRIALEAGDAKGAREAFAKAVTGDPGDPRMQYWLGVTAKAVGDVEDALDHLESAARLGHHDPETYVALGDLYRDSGSADDAIQAYEQAVACTPTDPRPHMRLGDLCAKMDLHEKALTHYGTAAALDSSDYHTWWAMARLYEGAARYREAADAYAEAVERSPDTGDVYYEAGLVQKKLRDYGRAAEMFKRATKKSPGLGSAYTQLATVSALHFLDRTAAEQAGREVAEQAARALVEAQEAESQMEVVL